MNPHPNVDKVFSDWLVQRSLASEECPGDRALFSIAIESPCSICQPPVAMALAKYLDEFDDNSTQIHWLPVTDHRLEQLQGRPAFREMLSHENASDPSTIIDYLGSQGGVILELPKCHQETASNPSIFQVSLSCKEPSEGNRHLWINAKRIPQETLIPMIANAFFDWACNGGDRDEASTGAKHLS